MARRMRYKAIGALAAAVWLIVTGPSFGQKDGNLLMPPPRQPATVAQSQSPVPTRTAPSLSTPPASALSASTLPASAPTATVPVGSAPMASGGGAVKGQKGPGILPNEHGQQWREYDLTPYTLRVRDVPHPEQAVIDWILRETGTEVWFREPLGILSATSTTLRVYHTPEMQEVVRGMLERVVNGDTEAHALGVRLMTVGSPNWRVRALSLLRPVDVKSPGVDAWLLSRENAASLLEQLKARADFREHSAPVIEVANGQTKALARTQPRTFVRGLQLKREFPFYDSIPGKIDEGYKLEISPLVSLDGQTIEAAIQCQVDQIEKMVPLSMDVPAGGQTQRVQVQVPQMASWRLSERFRWPGSDVLLLSCGVVASPEPGTSGFLSILSPLGMSSGRADALLMIDHRPPSAATLAATGPPPSAAPARVSGPPPATTTAPAVVSPAVVSPGSTASGPVFKAPTASATIGPPTGSSSSISRGRY